MRQRIFSPRFLFLVLVVWVVACSPRPSPEIEEFQDCDKCPLMVFIPPGEYIMGAREHDERTLPSEYPRRPVQIDYRFAVSKFEVSYCELMTCRGEGAARLTFFFTTPREGSIHTEQGLSRPPPASPGTMPRTMSSGSGRRLANPIASFPRPNGSMSPEPGRTPSSGGEIGSVEIMRAARHERA